MNPRLPYSLIWAGLLLILWLGLAAIVACESPTDDGLEGPRALGALEGMVRLVGPPCMTSGSPLPLCDPPLPDYEVIVFRSDRVTEAAQTRSDENAWYRVELESGDYVIFTQAGIDETMLLENKATIASGETTRLNLWVDTGIR